MSALPLMKPPETQGYLEAASSASGIIYGPFINGPFGVNLGINILGKKEKVCSFNCPYCDLGPTTLRLNRMKSDAGLPPKEEIETEVLEALKKIHSSGPSFDGICISGNGEPTLHHEFPEIAQAIVKARDLWFPEKPIIVTSNGASLDNRKVAEAANLLDERVIKVDCGSEKLFKQINAPLSRANLARILSGIRNLKDVTIQSLFFAGPITNTNPSDIDEWIEVIAIIKPKAVHIQGMTRAPAAKGPVACDEDTLYAIASKLERRTQIKAKVVV